MKNYFVIGALFLFVAADLAPGGCVTTQSDQDEALFAFQIACGSVSAADIGFQIWGGNATPQVRNIERQAVLAAQAICSGPVPTNPAKALASVNAALTAIANAQRQAQAN